MGRKKIKDELIEKIRKLYLEGYSVNDIAKKLNVSSYTASKYTKHLERTIATKGEIQRLINASKILDIDEKTVKLAVSYLSKREIVLYALNLIRLRPYLELINSLKDKKEN